VLAGHVVRQSYTADSIAKIAMTWLVARQTKTSTKTQEGASRNGGFFFCDTPKKINAE
jgi:hypothetical protein